MGLWRVLLFLGHTSAYHLSWHRNILSTFLITFFFSPADTIVLRVDTVFFILISGSPNPKCKIPVSFRVHTSLLVVRGPFYTIGLHHGRKLRFGM